MGKRIIISEEEKNQIKGLYQLNESLFDDAIDFIKEKGEDVVDFFSDVLDEPEKSIEKIKDKFEDDSVSNDEIKKLKEKIKPSSNEPKDDEDLRNVGESKMSAISLFKKINSDLNNKKLSFALVANAFGESGLNCNAKGDGGQYAQNKPKAIKIDGKKYCSFGLWQFNICGGLGISLLEYYDVEDSSNEEKLEVLRNCNKQIDFMTHHVKEKIKGTSQNKSVRGWIKWIVYEIERPADKENAVFKRFNWAKNNVEKLGLTNELGDEMS